MKLTRRKLLIAAAVSPLMAMSRQAPAADLVWSGFALGADAEIRFSDVSQPRARQLLEEALAEVRRLEAIFSLYRPGSEIDRLNRDGVLEAPSHDFRILLDKSLHYWRETGGAFNPAVQPLWTFLAGHFAKTRTPPPEDALKQYLAYCNPDAISVTAARVTLAPRMALTFNGIAQGYITDRVAELLAARGMGSVLVNLGEHRVLPGKAWSITPDGWEKPIVISNGAIAHSSGSATAFTPDRRWHHLINPATGHSAGYVASATVVSPTATEADALSTALFVMDPARHTALLNRFPKSRVWLGESAA